MATKKPKKTNQKTSRAKTQAAKVKKAAKQVDTAKVDDVKKQVLEQLKADQSRKRATGKVSAKVVLEQAGLKTREAPIAPQIKEDDLIAKEVLTMKTPEQRETVYREGVVPPPAGGSVVWQDRALTLVLLVGVVLIVGLLVFGRSPVTDDPRLALQNLSTALQQGEVSELEQFVDFERVAGHAVDQLQPEPVFDTAGLPKSLRDKLPVTDGEVNVREGLVALFAQDARSYVQGATVDELPEGLFKQTLMGITGGEVVNYYAVNRMVADETTAEATILVTRERLAQPIPLNVRLEKQDDQWVVVAIENLNETLTRVAALEAEAAGLQVAEAEAQRYTPFSARSLAAIEPAAGPVTVIGNDILKVFDVQRVRKASASGRGVGDAMLLTLDMVNASGKRITAFQACVVVMDADGRFMQVFDVKDTVGVGVGQVLQKTWRVPVNLRDRLTAHVYQLPQEALQMKVVPVQVTFDNGETQVLI